MHAFCYAKMMLLAGERSPIKVKCINNAMKAGGVSAYHMRPDAETGSTSSGDRTMGSYYGLRTIQRFGKRFDDVRDV